MNFPTTSSRRLTVPVFYSKFDDPIDVINIDVISLSTLRHTSPTNTHQPAEVIHPNPRQQATINDGRVTLQPVQGRQISFATGTTRPPITPGAMWNSILGNKGLLFVTYCRRDVLAEIESSEADPKAFMRKVSNEKSLETTAKVFTKLDNDLGPTGQTFTIVGNACPVTRITTTTEVPPRKPTTLEKDAPKPIVTLVYLRKPRKSKTNVPLSKRRPNCSLLQESSSNTPPSTPYVPPSRTDLDILFQPLFDELRNPPPSIDPPAPEVIAPMIAVVEA
ncbi:hypothetical protein Tco_0838125 [Tanacetum coccineum]|uniref:Uncharacterized protein n=1 Tax=Tanacetum coccineum TaxID=301880 RepID=A0ABQ5AR61_9ASTR